MVARRVTHSQKDPHHNVVALCNPDADWSPRQSHEVINDIEAGLHSYYVEWPSGKRTGIHLVNGPNGKYLRTDHDDTQQNNLDELPEC